MRNLEKEKKKTTVPLKKEKKEWDWTWVRRQALKRFEKILEARVKETVTEVEALRENIGIF